MTNDKKYNLLVDIAKLIKKYGAETFLNLYEEVSSPLFKERFAEIVLKTDKTAKEIGFNKPKKDTSSGTQRSFRPQLIHLSESQPKKAELLIKLYDDLTVKRFLPTLRDIRNFVADNGFQELRAKSRKNAIVPLVKQFINLEESDIQKIITNIPVVTENDDRSLAGWSNIILKKKQKNSEEQKSPKQDSSNNDV